MWNQSKVMLTTSFAIKTTKKKQQHKKEIDMLDGYVWLKISFDFTTNVTDQINCDMTSWQNGSKAYYISLFHLIWMLPLSNYHQRCRHLRLSFDFLEMFDHKHKLLVSDYVQMKKPNESVDTVGRSSGVSAETASFCVWLLRNLHQDQLMRKVAVHPLTASIRLVDLLPPVLLLLLLVRVHCPLIAGCISLSRTDEFIFSVFSEQWLWLAAELTTTFASSAPIYLNLCQDLLARLLATSFGGSCRKWASVSASVQLISYLMAAWMLLLRVIIYSEDCLSNRPGWCCFCCFNECEYLVIYLVTVRCHWRCGGDASTMKTSPFKTEPMWSNQGEERNWGKKLVRVIAFKMRCSLAWESESADCASNLNTNHICHWFERGRASHRCFVLCCVCAFILTHPTDRQRPACWALNTVITVVSIIFSLSLPHFLQS